MKQLILTILFTIAVLPAASAKDRDEISASEFELAFELSADTVFSDAAFTASLVVYSPYEINSAKATGQVQIRGLELLSTSEPEYLGRRMRNGHQVYLYLLAQYRLKATKSGKLRIKAPDFDITPVTYQRINDGFFYYTRPIEHSVRLRGIEAKLTVLSGKDPRIDTRRYPTAVAQITGMR